MPIQATSNIVPQWCRDLDRRLRAGEFARAEEYLDSATPLDPEDELELVYTEFVCREELGQTPATEEYLSRFPHLRTQLEEQFLVHRALHDAPAVVPAGGQTIGPYELVREIGRGSRGAVFLARDSRSDAQVAVKLLLTGEYSTPADLALFHHEAAVLARLDHPNLIQILDSGVSDGRPYLALEFADGDTLTSRVEEYRNPLDAALLVETLARAIHHAHLQGVVHRDLKPSNVLLKSSANGYIPKVTDFGLARVLDDRSARTRTGDIIGTLAYMAPEQAAGTAHRAGPPADVYALGAILYDLLTGRAPFGNAPTAETLYRVLHEPPTPPRRLTPGLSRDLETITLKCLEKAPDRRYPTALALAEDLGRFSRGQRVAARPPGAITETIRWAARRPTTSALIGVGFLSLVGLAVGTTYHNRELRTALTESDRLQKETVKANTDLRVSIARAEYFQSKTSQANSNLRSTLQTAEELREITSHQNDALEEQLDRSRRSMYALQLSQLPTLWIKEPVRARRLLSDTAACPPDLRDFTWQYYHRACSLDEREQTGHRGVVVGLAFLPEGVLVSGGFDGKVRVWSPPTTIPNQSTALGVHGKAITGVATDPKGQLILTAGRDGRVRLWPRELGTSIAVINFDAPANGIAVDPAGHTAAVPLDDGTVRIVTLPELKPGPVLRGHTGPALAVAFAPNGTSLATADRVGTVRLWRTVDGSLERAWSAHTDPVRAICFTPDSAGLVTGDDTGHVSIWDTITGGRLRVLSGHLFPVRTITFGPGGSPLLTGGEDTYIKLWDPQTGAELTNLMRRCVHAATISPDGEWVVSGDQNGIITYLRIPPFATVPRFPHDANLAAIVTRPDGTGVVTGDADGTIRVWEHGAVSPTAELSVSDQPARAVAVTPDGQTLVTAEKSTVVLADMRTGQVKARLTGGHTDLVTAAAFHPNGRLLATGSADQTIRIWDLDTREPVAQLVGHTDSIEAIVFDTAGRQLASVGDDKTARVWDTVDWHETHVLKGHAMWVLSAAFDPTGRWLATGSRDRTVRLWDLSGETSTNVLDGYTNWVYSVAFSPDGRTLAAASGHYSIDSPGEVKLLDPVTGYVRAILNDLRAPIAFGRDGDSLYSGVRGGVAVLSSGPPEP